MVQSRVANLNRLLINAIFPGEPTAWQRVGGHGSRVYKPKATRAAQEKLQWELKAIAPRLKPDATSRFGIQIVFSTKSFRKDWDNLSKLLTDAFNGKIWNDDSQIDEADVRMLRGALVPSTHFVCYKIEGEKL
jgi:Holliday junction resolvase RusA-like endonuclease